MSSKNIYKTPYFYIIRHISSGRLYAGCKYGKDANINTFLTKTGYKTSSKLVQSIINSEGIEAFQIILLLPEHVLGISVLDYETRFLQSNNIASRENWLNFHNNNGHSLFGTQKYKDLMMLKTGFEHSMQNPETKLKRERSNIEKYGIPFTASLETTKEKVASKHLATHGYKSNFSNPHLRKQYDEDYKALHGFLPAWSPEAKNKRSETNLKKGGHSVSLHTEYGIKKTKESLIKKYGVDNISKNEDIKKQKIKKSIEKYGVEHVVQSEEFKNKSKQTCLEKYGVTNWSQTPEGRLQSSKKVLAANRMKWTCPHCNTSGSGAANKTRWHFDNCKFKK